MRRPDAAAVARAALVAGTFSGAPSTIHALATGASPLAAARAAGELLGRPTLVRGAVAHTAITVGWTTVLAVTLPRGRTTAWGAAVGGAMAALDLAIADRRYPLIAALPRAAQVADHIAFGALVGATLARRRP